MMHAASPTPLSVIGSAAACKILGIDRSTLIRRIAAGVDPQPVGQLPGASGAYLFDRAQVERIAQAESLPAVGAKVRRGSGKTVWTVTDVDDRLIGLLSEDGWTKSSVTLAKADTLHLVTEGGAR